MNLQRIRKFIKKLLFLPPLPTLLIAVPSFALVFWVLGRKIENSPLAYISYVLSAYASVITVTCVCRYSKRVKPWINNHPLVKKALSIPFVGKYIEETAFRTEASLYMSLAINMVYAGIKLFSGICYRSVWFITLAVYYISLAVMRFSLLHYVRKRNDDKISELKRYRLCGIVLLIMNNALIGIIILAITENSGFEYPGMLIYVMAMYTFYAAITAAVNVVISGKSAGYFVSAAKMINLTAALVSVLSLEMAMLTQFGAADDPSFRRITIACTGAGVGIIVLGMAVYMICNAAKQLKSIRTEFIKKSS